VETGLRLFGNVDRRLVDSIVCRVDRMVGSQITRARGRLRKTIKKDLEINELVKGMLYDRR